MRRLALLTLLATTGCGSTVEVWTTPPRDEATVASTCDVSARWLTDVVDYNDRWLEQGVASVPGDGFYHLRHDHADDAYVLERWSTQGAPSEVTRYDEGGTALFTGPAGLMVARWNDGGTLAYGPVDDPTQHMVPIVGRVVTIADAGEGAIFTTQRLEGGSYVDVMLNDTGALWQQPLAEGMSGQRRVHPRAGRKPLLSWLDADGQPFVAEAGEAPRALPTPGCEEVKLTRWSFHFVTTQGGALAWTYGCRSDGRRKVAIESSGEVIEVDLGSEGRTSLGAGPGGTIVVSDAAHDRLTIRILSPTTGGELGATTLPARDDSEPYAPWLHRADPSAVSVDGASLLRAVYEIPDGILYRTGMATIACEAAP